MVPPRIVQQERPDLEGGDTQRFSGDNMLKHPLAGGVKCKQAGFLYTCVVVYDYVYVRP
jgi:hypothetical protein